MFGRKKKEESQELPEVKIYQKPKVQPVEVEEQEAPRQQVGIAKIISAELLEKGFRYIIISNKQLGNIGEEFPIE